MNDLTAGIILCGGHSRRMGRPKAWLPFGPELLLHRVARLVGEASRPVVVVAATGQDLPGLPDDVAIVRDPVADRGPLQGLAAGLSALPIDVEFAYATGTDAPFICPRWVEKLVERIGPNDLAIPEIDGLLHPLAALYRRRTVLPAVDALLAGGQRRVASLVERLATVRLGAEALKAIDPDLGTLRNLNTPEDYRRALFDAGFDPDRISED